MGVSSYVTYRCSPPFAGLDKPGKPGKLSSDLLSKFESDPSLSGPQLSTVGHSGLSAQSFTSSSEEIATTQENVK